MRKHILLGAILICLSLPGGLTSPATAQPGAPVINAEAVNDLEVLTLLSAHDGPIAEKSFDPTSSAFLTAGVDGQLCVWNVARLGQVSGRVRFCLARYMPGVSHFAWSPDGTQLAVYWGDQAQLDIYSARRAIPRDEWDTVEPVASLPLPELPLLSVHFATPDTVLTTDLDGVARLHTLALGTTLYAQPVVGEVVSAPDGETLYFLTETAILAVDARLGLARYQLDFPAEAALLAPDGRWLLAWNESEAYLWELAALADALAADASESYEPLALDEAVEGARFSPAENRLATWAGETVTLWDLARLEPTGTLRDHRGGVATVLFNGEGRRAISINARGQARFWEFNSQGVPFLSYWVDGEIDRWALSPDGLTLLVMRESFMARFFNFQNARLRGSYPLSTQALPSPDWTLVADTTGGLVRWVGLAGDERRFDWEPLGRAQGVVSVRPAATQDQPRIATLAPNAPVFALGRNPDGDWLRIQMIDGQQGWIQTGDVALADEADVEALPVAREQR